MSVYSKNGRPTSLLFNPPHSQHSLSGVLQSQLRQEKWNFFPLSLGKRESTFPTFLSHWVLGGVMQFILRIAIKLYCVAILTSYCTICSTRSWEVGRAINTLKVMHWRQSLPSFLTGPWFVSLFLPELGWVALKLSSKSTLCDVIMYVYTLT